MAKKQVASKTIGVEHVHGEPNGPTVPEYIKDWMDFRKQVKVGDFVTLMLRAPGERSGYTLAEDGGTVAEVGSHALFIEGRTLLTKGKLLEKVSKSKGLNLYELVGIPYYTIHDWEIG